MNGRLGVAGIALALLCLGAPVRVEAQCTLAAAPRQFEPFPPGVSRPVDLSPTSSALNIYHNAVGAPRMMNAETYGYSVLDLSNPANPTAIKYDDFQFDSNPITRHGDGQSYVATTAVSPDGQRIAFSMNGPASPPWHTLAGRNDGGEGFGMWGDFPPTAAFSTIVQAAGGRYIAYAAASSAITVADITSLPTSNFSALNIPYETSANMPGGYSMVLVGNYIVYVASSGVLTVFDASNPGPAGSITSAYPTAMIPDLASDPHGRPPASVSAAVDTRADSSREAAAAKASARSSSPARAATCA